MARGLMEREGTAFDIGTRVAQHTPHEANHLRLSAALPELSLSSLALSPRNSSPVATLHAPGRRPMPWGVPQPPTPGSSRSPKQFVVRDYVRGMYRSNDIQDEKVHRAREELARAAHDGELSPRKEQFYPTRTVGRTKWSDPHPEITVDGAPTWVVNVHSTVTHLEMPVAGTTTADALQKKRRRATQRAQEEREARRLS